MAARVSGVDSGGEFQWAQSFIMWFLPRSPQTLNDRERGRRGRQKQAPECVCVCVCGCVCVTSHLWHEVLSVGLLLKNVRLQPLWGQTHTFNPSTCYQTWGDSTERHILIHLRLKTKLNHLHLFTPITKMLILNINPRKQMCVFVCVCLFSFFRIFFFSSQIKELIFKANHSTAHWESK